MNSLSLYTFPGKEIPAIAEVGGKGLSLVIASKEDLPVPPGFILPVQFFLPWFEELKKSKSWEQFVHSSQEKLEHWCSQLKKEALIFEFTPQQNEVLMRAIKSYDTDILFAVRSSSPEEDLEGSSFAGGYETNLGVNRDNIHTAIKKAFISCLDYRVVVYKQQNEFDIYNPKIAVIIQEQIASDVAGVGFSINPLTNNYDEAVFNANWGLGETVVSGTATPDDFTVNTVTHTITQAISGKKERSLFLSKNGTLEEKKGSASNSLSLQDEQVLQLSQLIKRVEHIYKKPVDIEWAYAANTLYLLQVRPITTYIPLSSEMITEPGAQKRLYLDITSTLQGLSQPISVAGTSFFKHIMKHVGKTVFLRDITTDIDTAIPWVSSGKLYANLSSVLKVFGKQRVIKTLFIIDPLTAHIVENLNEKEYLSKTNNVRLLPWGVMRRLPHIAKKVHHGRNNPLETHSKTQLHLQQFKKNAQRIAAKQDSLTHIADSLIYALIHDVLLHTVPLFISGKVAFSRMKKIAGKNYEEQLEKLETALPHNVTTEMGLALYKVSQLLPKGLSQEDLEKQLEKNTLPEAVVPAWKEFITMYGHRGPAEIDIACSRYNDTSSLLAPMLTSMMHLSEADNPQAQFEKKQAINRGIYSVIYQDLAKENKKHAEKFAKEYTVFETFAGYRETHKYYLVYVINLMRQKILTAAQSLHAEKRIEYVEQAFDLTLEELDQAIANTHFDVKTHIKANRVFIDTLARIHNPPSVIDSRGFIPHPPTQTVNEGVITGTPISAGVAKGRIKVLHSPNEKPLLKGEILVARATDPGWTPLFINAAAVILEVGGSLQHGALVAREYGIPCVAGIEHVTELWKDGTLVEVDGATGVIKQIN